MTPTRPGPSASQQRAAEAVRARDELAGLMAMQHARFAASCRPVIPAPARPDAREFATQEWNRRRREARWWQRSQRRGIRAEVALAARRHVEELYAEAVRHAAEEQARADAWWDALNAGQPAVTRAALEAAFAANRADVHVIEVAGAAATLALRLPGSSALPERRPHVSPTGKLTTKAWTQTELNNAYADLLGVHLLATLRQTWAVAPSIQQARVIGILDAEPGPQVLFDVTSNRADGRWNEATHGQAVLQAAPQGLRRVGRTHAIQAWPAEQLRPDVATWVRPGSTLGARPRPAPAAQLSTVGYAYDGYAAAASPSPAPTRSAATPIDRQPPRNRSRWGAAATFLAAHPTRRAGLNWVIWAAAAAVLFIVIAGVTSSPKTTPTADRATSTRIGTASSAATLPATSPASSTAGSGGATATTTSSASPRPANTTGAVRVLAGGVVLPDPARTPGATNPAVSPATIATTICVSGWTATVRPPSSYTTAVKVQQLSSGYAYHGDTNTSDYEEDHLIPLELGGAPRSVRNLWPEPYHVTEGAYSKDKIENKLHALVCAGSLSLDTARHAIAANWVTAYQRYIGVPTSTPSTTSRPPPTTTYVAPAPQSTAPAAPAGATAICNDGSYSYSQHRSGTCSHHGGVRVWL